MTIFVKRRSEGRSGESWEVFSGRGFLGVIGYRRLRDRGPFLGATAIEWYYKAESGPQGKSIEKTVKHGRQEALEALLSKRDVLPLEKFTEEENLV